MFLTVAIVEIFVNKLETNEHIIDCFLVIFLLLITELLYQLRYFTIVTKYGGNLLIILNCVQFAEISVSMGHARIYPGMLTGVALQCF